MILLLFQEFISLIFPRVCPGCHRVMKPQETIICLHCRMALHRPSFQVMDDFRNKFNLPLHFLYAHWRFIRYGRAQHVIHAIKYGKTPLPARRLGREIGSQLPAGLKGLLVPVPQHPLRAYGRGFNQAAELARGIAERTSLELQAGMLKRRGTWKSQTKRSRLHRLQALEESVYVARQLKSDHYFLVDDVVTTGATLQTCAYRIMKEYPDCRIGLIVAATV
ncbi:MAG: hypothetical protein P8X57_05225 [Cyclobacteriaceae bacterium]